MTEVRSIARPDGTAGEMTQLAYTPLSNRARQVRPASHSSPMVTGTIGVKLYKGSARVVTRESPNAVYDAQLASFAESGGLFSQEASPGFIELWSLQSRLAHRLRERSEG